jgi:glycerol-3-phosphate cytidylyltransferase
MNVRVMVDMSVSLLHHGHIRILKKAAEYGDVVVALSSDYDIEKNKGQRPLLTWEFRKEIVESIRYVSEVVEAPYIITNAVLDKHDVRFLVHGDDNFNMVSEDRVIIFPRTSGISSTMLLVYNRRAKIITPPADSDFIADKFDKTQSAEVLKSSAAQRTVNQRLEFSATK